MKHTTIWTLLICTLMFGCKKESTEPALTDNPAKEIRNVEYGNASLLQKMDILFPKGYGDKTPVAFVIHGGGFVAGTKEDFEREAQLMKDQQFIVVNLSHRLVDSTGLLSLPPQHRESEVKVTDQLKDIEAAVNHFVAHAAEYGAGTDRMYMAGHSAGAILAMLYVQGKSNTKVRASGNWAGLTEMSISDPAILNQLDPRWKELLFRTTGKEPTEANALHFMGISPYWVSNATGGKPNISVFPENNLVFFVPGEKEYQYETTKNYHNLLKGKKVAEKLVYLQGEDHGYGTKPGGSWGRVIKETADFFKAH